MTDLQERFLGLLKQFDQLCRDNDVEYYLVGGTLIGAMRHKGFIPWDDDVDIHMTRDNWEKFYVRTKDKLPENIVIDTDYDETAPGQHIIRFIDTSVSDIYRYNIPYLMRAGMPLDIFILDPIPDSAGAKKEYARALAASAELTTLFNLYGFRILEDTHFFRYWVLSRIFGLKKVIDYIGHKAFFYSEAESELYISHHASAPHTWPKEVYGKPKYVPFENMMVPVPSRPEDYLCVNYEDDWMQIPRGGPSKSTHEFCVRSLTIPAECIINEFKRHIDQAKATKTYVKRKKKQTPLVGDRVKSVIEADRFIGAKVQLDYEKKLAGVDLQALLASKDYAALDELFSGYLEVQCATRFIGSSSLGNWNYFFRKYNPFLIDIGDEALYAVLFLLMHQQKLGWIGKVLKARKALDRPLTGELREMDGLYGAIKAATSTYDCGEDERCREILAQWLPRYPENPFLWRIDLKEQVRRGLSGQRLIEAAQEGLALFPEDPELLYIQAEQYLALNRRERALEIFRGLIDTTNHGIVLLHIREHLEKMLEREPEDKTLSGLWLDVRRVSGEEDVLDLEEDEELSDGEEQLEEDAESADGTENAEGKDSVLDKNAAAEEYEREPLTDIQQKRLQLLGELADMCAENGIKYSLFGKTMLQAARGGAYVDTHGELTVVMTPENGKKFISVFERTNLKDRYLNSMDTNPMFHRFCIQYCAADSLDFRVSRSGCGEHFGIFVTIEILRYPSQNNLVNKVDQVLERGWEATLATKWSSWKVSVARGVVAAMNLFFGRKRVAKGLFRHFINGPKKEKKGSYYLRAYWGKRKFYQDYLFKYTCRKELEDKSYSVIKLHEQYLKKTFGVKWRTRRFPMTKKPDMARFVDANISSEEYLRYIEAQGIDRNEYWRLWYRVWKKWMPSVLLSQEISHYWDVMCLCGERYRLWEKYIPMRQRLRELFENDDIETLMSELADYYNTAVAFSKKKLGVCFDKEIFELLEYCLIAKGRAAQAKKFRRLVPKEDWAPLQPVFQ